MSAAEVLLAGNPPRARVSTRFLRSELKIIFGRRRNIAGLAVLAAVPVILAIAVRVSSPGQGDGPDFITAIAGNGLFVAFAALALELPLFLPLAVSAIMVNVGCLSPVETKQLPPNTNRLFTS